MQWLDDYLATGIMLGLLAFFVRGCARMVRAWRDSDAGTPIGDDDETPPPTSP